MTNTSDYRNDIQVLRALCALTIMISHIWLNKVSGGVDVFFVISGFFMAAGLCKLDQLSSIEGYFIFWRKVLTKVVPTALVIIALTTGFAYFSVFPQRAEIIRSGIISVLFLENINLILQKTNYLQSHNKSAFQQFWALSIQFQFYLVYPFVFFLFKQKRLLVLGAITLLSFIYSVYLVNDNPTAAYYHPITRLWELTAGGIVYLLYRRPRHHDFPQLATLAFIGLMVFAFFFPANSNFPGFSSLIPVLLACLILSNRSTNLAIQWLKQNRFLLWIAQFSFTLYLVHWPIFIFSQYLTLSKTISLSNGLLIIACSLLIAFIIHQYIEKPMTQKLNQITMRNFYTVITLSCLFAFCSFALLYIENKAREQHALEQLNDERPSYTLLDNILSIRTIGVSLRSRNECMSNSSDVIVCDWGDPEASRSIAIIGGSHIEQWIPLFDDYGKNNHFKVLQITKVDCPLGGAENSSLDCQSWSKEAIDKVAKNTDIQYIFTNSTRTFDNGQVESIPKNYLESFERLQEKSSAKLIGVRDNPRFQLNPNYCLTNLLIKNEHCHYDLNQYMAQQDPTLDQQHLITPVDFTPLICEDPKTCPLYQDDIPIYADTNHLSYLFVNSIHLEASKIIDLAIESAQSSAETSSLETSVSAESSKDLEVPDDVGSSA